jgi:hypothetical protein
MKMIKNLIFGLTFISLTLNIVTAIKIKSEDVKDVNLGSQYSPQHHPAVIRELFRKVLKLNPIDSDVRDMCMDLMINGKNNEALSQFWTKLQETQSSTTIKQKWSRDLFKNFIQGTSEAVNVENIKKSCTDVVQKNLMDSSDIENIDKQRELQAIVYPYLPASKLAKGGKNIITAFIGVHRDTDAGRELITKLNGHK